MSTPILDGGAVSRDFDSQTVGGVLRWQNLAVDRSGAVVSPTFTVSASPDYAAGDVVAGAVAIPAVVETAGRMAQLLSLTVRDESGQAPALALMFFRASLTGTYTDNAAFAWGAGDFAKFLGSVEVLASDYVTRAGKSWTTKGGLDVGHDATSTGLVVVPVIPAGGSWNAAATTDLSINFYYGRR